MSYRNTTSQYIPTSNYDQQQYGSEDIDDNGKGTYKNKIPEKKRKKKATFTKHKYQVVLLTKTKKNFRITIV